MMADKQYYTIIRKYQTNPFTSGFMVPCFCEFYHGYLFRADQDGPSLIYDAVYTDSQEGQQDLDKVAAACDLMAEALGVHTAESYNAVLAGLFHNSK